MVDISETNTDRMTLYIIRTLLIFYSFQEYASSWFLLPPLRQFLSTNLVKTFRFLNKIKQKLSSTFSVRKTTIIKYQKEKRKLASRSF